jgi:hypothetical protein
VSGRVTPTTIHGKVAEHERRLRQVERRQGGGGGQVGMVAIWDGLLPPVVAGPAGGVWQVPYLNGVGVTFDLTRAYFRFESPSTAGSYEVEIQWSPAGSTFVAHAICDLTVAAGANETSTVTALGSVTSGELLRVDWLTIGANAATFTVQLEGVQAP